MTHFVNIIYVHLQRIYGDLCTFGYLGSVRDNTDGFEPIINGFIQDLNSKAIGHFKYRLKYSSIVNNRIGFGVLFDLSLT